MTTEEIIKDLQNELKNRIKPEQLYEMLDRIIDSAKAWKSYIRTGTDMGSYYNEIEELESSTKDFLENLHTYSIECDLEEQLQILLEMRCYD